MSKNKYRLPVREVLAVTAICTGLAALISWLFYRSVYGMFVLLLLLPFGLKYRAGDLKRRQTQRLEQEFKECILLVAGALAAGYSVEHAWQAAEPDIRKLYGEKSPMYQKLVWINSRTALNEPIEASLETFAWECGLPDVMQFCSVFSFAKRSGGNLVQIIGDTARQISDKCEVMQEIEAVTASKRLEQRVMNVIPLLLLTYIRLTSPEFLEPIYHNLTGIAVMSVGLLVYGAAFLIAGKIVRIEV